MWCDFPLISMVEPEARVPLHSLWIPLAFEIGILKRNFFCPKCVLLQPWFPGTSTEHLYSLGSYVTFTDTSCRIFASLVSVPGQAFQLPPSVSLLSQTPVCQWAFCPKGAPKTLPPLENDPQSPGALNFHLLSPSPFSEESWVFDFVFYEVWLLWASFPIMPLSFKSIFLRIYEVVYRAYLWSKLCGFYIYLIRG